MEPQVRYARTSDRVNIAWYAIGSGPAFVWPSVPPSSSVTSWRVPEFRQITEAITRRGTLVSYDPRGFGMSDRGSMDYSCEAFLHDLEAVIDAASVERCVLLGFSYGSMPYILYAARHPERVVALLLLNGIMRGADLSPSWRRLVRMAEEDWEDALTWLARMNMAGYASTVTLEQTREVMDQAATQGAFLAFADAMKGWDVSHDVAEVTAPALVTHYGPQSTFHPLDACRRLAASLPNGTFVSIEPVADEQIVDAATRAILNFMRGVVPPDPRRHRADAAPAPSGTAIILFADIVDSTALTERLGDAAFRAKARELDGALRSVIREHAGTPIEGKLLGDGVLAVFTSARQAIEAALVCATSGSDAGLPLHLGLHAGDVIREDNNVYGGAVNIASRISALSAPGEVLVSDIVRGLARTSAGVRFEDRGEQSLKGVGEPVRVWVVREAE
jgi:class 3 adenylate cyclase